MESRGNQGPNREKFKRRWFPRAWARSFSTRDLARQSRRERQTREQGKHDGVRNQTNGKKTLLLGKRVPKPTAGSGVQTSVKKKTNPKCPRLDAKNWD